ncbi:MAG: IS3 family transposase [Thaumarchaeota archaeon]|nr:IS3 family transposase [Nitrososphaerota archaeon]
MGKVKRYAPEVRERAVRMVMDNHGEFQSQWAAIQSVSQKLGMTPETLRAWVRRAEIDNGKRDGITTAETERIRALEREVRELRRANEILKDASIFFATGAGRSNQDVVSYIDCRKSIWGVQPICRVLQFAPSTYYAAKARPPSPRALRDEVLKQEITRVYAENYSVYGARKIWYQLQREGFSIARCTIERLMTALGISGVRRGRGFVRTTISDDLAMRPKDLVERNFSATGPNHLWVADLTYVKTKMGWAYVAFIVDVFARMIVGWKVSSSLRSDLATDALDMAIYSRSPKPGELVHHNDKGVQYLSLRYTARLEEAGITPSVGSKGDSYDNALAETVNGLYKTEMVYRHGPFDGVDDLEWATLLYVDWFNNRRIHGSIGMITPAEFERNYYAQISLGN